MLVTLIQQKLTNKNARSIFCLEIFLCLKASRHCVPAESNVIRFTVVKEWPLTEPGMLERTRHWFFLPKRSLGKLVACWRLMWLFGNILYHRCKCNHIGLIYQAHAPVARSRTKARLGSHRSRACVCVHARTSLALAPICACAIYK